MPENQDAAPSEPQACPKCDGMGTVWWWDEDGNGERVEGYYECFECEGTGETQPDEEAQP